MAENAQPRSSVLVALTHATLNTTAFTSIADVADAVKSAAARHRVPYTGAAIAAALRSVGACRPLVTRSPSSPFPEHRTTGDARYSPLSHARAVDWLDRVRARHVVKSFSAKEHTV